MWASITGIGALLFYMAAAYLIGQRIHTGASLTGAPLRAVSLLTLSAILLHGGLLYHQVIIPGGLDVGFVNSISLVAWFIAILVLFSSLMQPVASLGIVVYPWCAVTVMGNLLFSDSPSITVSLNSGVHLHIVLAIIAYSVLAIAALQSILLAWQDRQLRNRHPGTILRTLPPLQTMEAFLFQLISIGFLLLSLAILSGMVFLEDMFAQHVVHKTVLSIIAWLIFAILLWGRWKFGWRGRVAIRWSLSGFAILVLAFFGSKMVLELILSR